MASRDANIDAAVRQCAEDMNRRVFNDMVAACGLPKDAVERVEFRTPGPAAYDPTRDTFKIHVEAVNDPDTFEGVKMVDPADVVPIEKLKRVKGRVIHD